jgi:hypothetical protein
MAQEYQGEFASKGQHPSIHNHAIEEKQIQLSQLQKPT